MGDDDTWADDTSSTGGDSGSDSFTDEPIPFEPSSIFDLYELFVGNLGSRLLTLFVRRDRMFY